MKETPQEYIRRILSYLGGQHPLDVQGQTADQLERLIERASASRLRTRPAPGKWSIAEIVAHLADSEIVISWRIRAILTAPGTAIQVSCVLLLNSFVSTFAESGRPGPIASDASTATL